MKKSFKLIVFAISLCTVNVASAYQEAWKLIDNDCDRQSGHLTLVFLTKGSYLAYDVGTAESKCDLILPAKVGVNEEEAYLTISSLDSYRFEPPTCAPKKPSLLDKKKTEIYQKFLAKMQSLFQLNPQYSFVEKEGILVLTTDHDPYYCKGPAKLTFRKIEGVKSSASSSSNE
ncbi:MAG: hypothetical protein HYX41_03115 [Bdellovibrio sp.]|nr:hypothetical protein [Bdellovibrio sp.]